MSQKQQSKEVEKFRDEFQTRQYEDLRVWQNSSEVVAIIHQNEGEFGHHRIQGVGKEPETIETVEIEDSGKDIEHYKLSANGESHHFLKDKVDIISELYDIDESQYRMNPEYDAFLLLIEIPDSEWNILISPRIVS